jgi:hypothetical protein
MGLFDKMVEDVQFMYAFYGWYIIVAIIIFVLVYGFISYLAASNTTTQSFNMGLPVGDYVGDYWATYLANVIISVPLTIIVVWLLLHLVKVVFRVDLIDMIKQALSDKPIFKWIDKIDSNLEMVEHTTANFLVKIKDKIETQINLIKPYRKTDGEGFSNISNDEVEEAEDVPTTVSSYSSNTNNYTSV